MNDMIMNFSRLIAYRQRDPQPRVHKCGVCGCKFKCAPCTRTMRYRPLANHALDCANCVTKFNQYGPTLKPYLCQRCK